MESKDVEISAEGQKSFLRRLLFVEYNERIPSSVIACFVIFGLMFATYALRLDDDPEVCYASYESDAIWLNGPKTDFQEVGQSFRNIFVLCFGCSVLQILFSMQSYMSDVQKNKNLFNIIIGSTITV